MKIFLKQAHEIDCEKIHKMQRYAFAKLLGKYHDFDTNPAAESLDAIKLKMAQPQTKYYFIMLEETEVGAIRIVSVDSNTCRISPIFILPEYQNNGYARQAIFLAEKMYNVDRWLIDTIKQENNLCHFYEKLGYVLTGKEEQIKDGMTIVYYKKVNCT